MAKAAPSSAAEAPSTVRLRVSSRLVVFICSCLLCLSVFCFYCCPRLQRTAKPRNCDEEDVGFLSAAWAGASATIAAAATASTVRPCLTSFIIIIPAFLRLCYLLVDLCHFVSWVSFPGAIVNGAEPPCAANACSLWKREAELALRDWRRARGGWVSCSFSCPFQIHFDIWAILLGAGRGGYGTLGPYEAPGPRAR